jgi:AefR-like transcriptional repressor, C-terminal domain
LFVDVLRRHIHENFGDWLLEEATGEDFPATREELRDVLRSLVERFFATLMRPEYLALMRVVIAETPRFPYLGELLKQMAPERMMKLVSTLLKRADERGLPRSRMWMPPGVCTSVLSSPTCSWMVCLRARASCVHQSQSASRTSSTCT